MTRAANWRSGYEPEKAAGQKPRRAPGRRGGRGFCYCQAAYGQLRVSNELKKQGIFISPGSVRSVWLHHDLETFQKRLKALEAKAAQEHFILTEDQLQTMEKAKQEKEAHGEIETEHPGYLGAQDNYYSGHDQKDRPDLSADLYRHLHQGRLC